MRVLIAEDDELIREGIVQILEGEGYSTLTAQDGAEALRLFRAERPDFVCLDIMMPRLSGFDVCREIRKEDPDVPLVFITARTEELDTVLGLELGADDFIVKPFGVREVVARIRAVSRRCLRRKPAGASPVPFRMGDLQVLPAELRARRDGQAIDLNPRDLKILQLLHERQGEAVDRQTFFDVCWGLDHLPNSRTLDQHISQLRKRIEVDPRRPNLVRTVHGVGYRFDPKQAPGD
ncbi:MAG: response regulator transcription factor [Myxococcales bacterium]|nr:response regulator transcription factor [Myxococcales bacterium]